MGKALFSQRLTELWPQIKNSAAPTALSPIQQKNQINWILININVKITLSFWFSNPEASFLANSVQVFGVPIEPIDPNAAIFGIAVAVVP